MLSTNKLLANLFLSDATAGDVIREHRARVAIEEEARQEKRRAAQAEQCESSSTPEARVRAWEKIHGLRLPSDNAHPVVTLIAAQTHLSIAEVRQEQAARKAALG